MGYAAHAARDPNWLCPWISVEIYGFPLEFNGFPLEFRGFPLELHGFQLELHGFPIGIPWDP